MSDPRPIGVFDSGVGGLTVLREIIRRAPHESTIYLGDNERAPYGVRPDDEVLAFSTQALDALAERDVKAIVVACNTSTAVGIGAFRRRYAMPVLGVIRPGAQATALSTRNRRVGVIATPATIRSHAYFASIKDENPAIEVYEHATPTLVPMVEAGPAGWPRGRGDGRRGTGPAAGRARRRRRIDLPAPAGCDDRHAAARLHPLPAPATAHRRGRRGSRGHRRFGDGHRVRPGRTAHRQRPRGAGTTRGTAADAGLRGHERPDEVATPASHLQLTTGDAERFAAMAARMFGADFPDVESIDLAVDVVAR